MDTRPSTRALPPLKPAARIESTSADARNAENEEGSRRTKAGNACERTNRWRHHGLGTGKCPPFGRDAAAAEGNRAAQRRTGGDQQHPARAWRAELDFQAIVDLRRRQAARSLPIGRHRDPVAGQGSRPRPLPLRLRARRANPARPDAHRPRWAHYRGHAQATPAGARQSRRGRSARDRDTAGHRSELVERLRAGLQRRPRPGLDRARELRAGECVRRCRGPPAVDSRLRHGCRARERAPLRRDAAAAEGNRAARRRTGDHQRGAAGAGRRTRYPGCLRRRGRQAARNLPAVAGGHPGRATARPARCAFPMASSTASASIPRHCR